MTRTLRAGRRVPARWLAVAGLLLWPAMAGAEQIDTGIPDLKIRWDNTIKYSAAFRTEGRDSRLTGAANYDDGDRNFGRGLISNRVDLLSEFDLSYQGYGFRVSGAGWYDTVYNRSTDNDSAGAVNSLNSSGRFNNDTRRLHGRQVELLDAFVFGKTDIDDTTLSGRAGRHALVWGESLFFGENGIAGGQSPIDVVKALSVPNTPFKELIRPVNQLSSQWQVAPTLSFGAYYQLEWRKTRLPGAGSYFSTSDNLDVGGERILAGAAPFPGAATPAFYRAGDLKPRDGGQGGIQVKFQLPGDDTDFGLYATRFHAKDPNVYLYPGSGYNPATGSIGSYRLVYHEGILAFGGSFSKSIGDINLAGEVSYRDNAPLTSLPQVVTRANADNRDNALYAIGRTAHAQVSVLYTVPPNLIAEESSLVGEIAWNTRLAVTKNREALDPEARVSAVGLRMVYEPTYRQVLPGLDIGVPIGFGYNPNGKSQAVQSFNGGVSSAGDISVGVNANYLDVWRLGVNYTHYIGAAGAFRYDSNARTYKQSLADRDFISVSARRTF